MNSTFEKNDIFGFDVPVELENVSSDILNPKKSWINNNIFNYDKHALKLAKMFKENYKQYVDAKFTDYSSFGPK